MWTSHQRAMHPVEFKNRTEPRAARFLNRR
jgi:hypothetical protein